MPRRALLLWFSLVLTSILGAWGILQWQSVGVLFRCPLRDLTGIPCPTCGGTHAVRALFDLDLATAFGANPLLTLSAILFAASGLFALAAVPWARSLQSGWIPRGKWVAWLILALVAVNWIYLFVQFD